MNDLIENIQRNIQDLMGEREWDQVDLARRAKVDQGTVSKILSGETRNPRAATLVDIARALDVTVSDLTGEKLEQRGEAPVIGPVAFFRKYYEVDETTAEKMRNIVEDILDWGRVLRRRRRNQ